MREFRRRNAATLMIVVGCAVLASTVVWAAEPRFEMLSEHCYVLQVGEDGPNVEAVVTDDGVLLVNPPDEPGLTVTTEALRRLTPKAVRWVVGTDYRIALSKGAAYYSERGAVMLESKDQADLLSAIQGEGTPLEAADRLVFGRQMHLFPGGIEVRIFGVPHKAYTRADVVVFVPAEKVIVVGDLFTDSRYPEIDHDPGQGDALGWLDGIKYVIDSIPLLKPAITQPKTDDKPKEEEEEKTLEELEIVISSHGAPSNLQQMKDLLNLSQKLRAEMARTVSARRTCDSFLTSPAAAPFQIYGNLGTYARALYDALIKQ